MLRIFWCVVTVLITMLTPSVSTQVWLICGEPSGIRVVRKQIAGARSTSIRPAGNAAVGRADAESGVVLMWCPSRRSG